MYRLLTTLLLLAFLGALSAAERGADAPEWQPEWQIVQPERTASSLPPVLSDRDLLSDFRTDSHRPRLSVAFPGRSGFGMFEDPATSEAASPFSWSLEAWQLNTASLAHIQCSRATHTLESFLAEDCRFVDQPPPSDAAGLVQVRGQWLAAPGLQLGAGIFSGHERVGADTTVSLFEGGLIPGLAAIEDQIDGVNMNLSFGVHAGRIGDLLVDLQVARYRRQGTSFSMLAGLDDPTWAMDRQYQTASQLALGWRRSDFSADLVHNYRELPYWFGNDTAGQPFSSFDIEFSWRAPRNASFSVGVSNILDRLPAAESGGDNGFDDHPVEGIYGRIPYVRYKHDL